MGPGSRFEISKMHDGFGLGIVLSRFPYAFTITLIVGIWGINIGFGKSYLE